jgi:hypothetical protein
VSAQLGTAPQAHLVGLLYSLFIFFLEADLTQQAGHG